MTKIVMIAVVLMMACSKNEVSFSTVEDARAQAKDNATQNAQIYRAENKLADYQIYSRGDSTISNTCPNGDGWASIDLIRTDSNERIKLKCSTVSRALGCVTDADFKTKVYAEDEGKCQPLNKVPHPLPKLTQ